MVELSKNPLPEVPKFEDLKSLMANWIISLVDAFPPMLNFRLLLTTEMSVLKVVAALFTLVVKVMDVPDQPLVEVATKVNPFPVAPDNPMLPVTSAPTVYTPPEMTVLAPKTCDVAAVT